MDLKDRPEQQDELCKRSSVLRELARNLMLEQFEKQTKHVSSQAPRIV